MLSRNPGHINQPPRCHVPNIAPVEHGKKLDPRTSLFGVGEVPLATGLPPSTKQADEVLRKLKGKRILSYSGQADNAVPYAALGLSWAGCKRRGQGLKSSSKTRFIRALVTFSARRW